MLYSGERVIGHLSEFYYGAHYTIVDPGWGTGIWYQAIHPNGTRETVFGASSYMIPTLNHIYERNNDGSEG